MPNINKLPKIEELTGTEEIAVFSEGKTKRTEIQNIIGISSIDIEALSGMDLSQKGAGYIIYYNENEEKWKTKPLNLDGGTY